jgi:diguanylate cyclase (GGDEF)-like protein
VQDRDLGLLRLDHDMAGSFSAHDIDRLRPFASAAAIALENARLFREVQRLATIDDLTGIYNRRALFEQAAREVQRAVRFAHPLSITMFDLDHFKQVNDTHGHAAGDQALRMVAQRCRESIRAVDILGRFGGEEFVVVLPETNTAGACLAAERVRRRIVDTPIVTDHGAIRVTCSLGVTSLGPNDDFDTLLKRADQALYDAKAAGRNCVRARDPQVKSGPCGFDTKP